MSNWISVDEKLPPIGANVIAVGTWCGEINGIGESEYMGIGTWNGKYVSVDSDIYSTDIIDITHWMPIPETPEVNHEQC